MNSIKVKNLRSLTDTGHIEIKPLTIVVGKNSSGKSTFLRSFPLFKQTFEKRTSEPLLWYGDQTDFGSFEESLNNRNEGSAIEFDFNFSNSFDNDLFYRRRLFSLPKVNEKYNFEVNISILKKNLKSIGIKYAGHTIKISLKDKFSLESIVINGVSINVSNYTCYYFINSLIPFIAKKETYYKDIFNLELLEELKKLTNKNTKEERLDKIISSLKLWPREDIIEKIKNCGLDSIKSKFEDNKISHDTLDLIIAKYLFSQIDLILEIVEEYISDYYSSINYVAPIRAKAERYYRIQGLAVENINPTGDNIAIFLNSLNKPELKEFREWCLNNFNFDFDVSAVGGHISLKIKGKNEEKYINLADTGFGFSQILPILILIWNNKRTKKRTRINVPITLVIEQPELHLHPAMQSQLIDSFINILGEKSQGKNSLNIIIETHSREMINRIGQNISLERINENDVGIYIFEKDKENKTLVKKSNFDSDGYLLNWPIGFFDSEEL